MRIGDEIRASVRYTDGGSQRHKWPVTRDNIGDYHQILDELEEKTGIDHVHAVKVNIAILRDGLVIR